jgi:hypothetical protein
MPRTTRELLDIASNHADGEEAVSATVNTPQVKGKQVVDHGKGTSSCFKKKKKNDKRCRDDNFVDHIEKLLDAPCLHHEVPIKHMLRECRLMKNYVKGTFKPKMVDQPDKQGPSHDNNDARGLCSPVKMPRCT